MFTLASCMSQPASSVSVATRSTVTTSGADNDYYQVRRGDNLYRIGLKYGQNVNTLMRWNNLKNAHQLEVGQLIRVQRPKSATTVVSQQNKRATKNRATTSTNTSVRGAPNVSLAWPVKGPVITQFNGQTQKGIDIAGSLGMPVKAAAAGTVQYAGEELRGYGKLILIKHSTTTMTAYAYNDHLLVRNGQRVAAGQQIATMGSSGNVDRVKLHFEVRVNSQAIDPLIYLPK